MVEQKQASDKENNRSAPAATDRPASKDVGPVEAVILSAAMGMAKLWNALTRDGVLAASFRQGADELGAALKAFPDSIQREESGTILNPTQGEIAAGREQNRDHGGFWICSSASRPMWPSEIADQNRHQPGKDHGPGLDNGHDAGASL
jgi:hypothetical protein